MNNENTDLSCPCMPQCPNYGKCRQCIAMHAKFNTPPKCVKLMQENMKKNHLHPINPHMKKSLPERIADYYAENPGEHLRSAAEALKITEWQLLDAMPDAIPVPVEDFAGIYDELAALDRVMLHADTGCVLLQLETALPKAMDMRGVTLLKCGDAAMSLTSLLFTKAFYALYLVRESLYGKESLSLAVVGEDEKIALSIYMRRKDGETIDPESKMLFERLWVKYNIFKGE